MTKKPKRPAVLATDSLDLNSLMVGSASASGAHVEVKAPDAAPAKGEAAMFRTSVYFSRAVHDKLRAIAFEERKSVTDLINEGLDHVLAARNYPSTAELKEAKA